MSPTVVDPTDRETLEAELERFASDVTRREGGALVADFGGRAFFAVEPDGIVDAGMPLHDFDGRARRLSFDHDSGSIDVTLDTGDDTATYTFRRP